MSEVIQFPMNSEQQLSAVVAANVRAEMARRGLKQRHLSDALSLAQAAVSDRYRGRTPWTINEIETVSRLLGTTVSNLMVRPEGFEPPTFWLGAYPAVIDLSAYREQCAS